MLEAAMKGNASSGNGLYLRMLCFYSQIRRSAGRGFRVPRGPGVSQGSRSNSLNVLVRHKEF